MFGPIRPINRVHLSRSMLSFHGIVAARRLSGSRGTCVLMAPMLIWAAMVSGIVLLGQAGVVVRRWMGQWMGFGC